MQRKAGLHARGGSDPGGVIDEAARCAPFARTGVPSATYPVAPSRGMSGMPSRCVGGWAHSGVVRHTACAGACDPGGSTAASGGLTLSIGLTESSQTVGENLADGGATMPTKVSR